MVQSVREELKKVNAIRIPRQQARSCKYAVPPGDSDGHGAVHRQREARHQQFQRIRFR